MSDTSKEAVERLAASVQECVAKAHEKGASDFAAYLADVAETLRTLSGDVAELECLRNEDAVFARAANSEIVDLRKERDRLREALEKIAGNGWCEETRNIARQALSGERTEG